MAYNLIYERGEGAAANYYVSGIEKLETTDIVIIPDQYNGQKVIGIKSQAFANQTNLTKLIIGNNVTTIDSYAFSGCSNLTSVIIPNSVKSISNYAFAYCSSLTNVIIPDSVISIGYDAFYECSKLTNVTIGNKITSIGQYMFYGCIGLKSITIPNSVKSIGNYAFYNCSSLTSIIIPDSVESIGAYAFKSCSSLKNLISFATNPPTLGADAFTSNIESIYVPEIAKNTYETNWNSISNISTILKTNDIYLSFAQFNQQNKQYINSSINTIYSSINRTINTINRTINTIEQRLISLGFKEGSVSLDSSISGTATQNEVKRQGNYVFGTVQVTHTVNVTGSNANGSFTLGFLPVNFRPKTKIICGVMTYGDGYGSYIKYIPCIKAEIDTDGKIVVYYGGEKYTGNGGATQARFAGIQFGFEANPL